MNEYVLTYDLTEAAADYGPLRCRLQDELRAKKILASTWLVRTALSPVELRVQLEATVGPRDRLLIVGMNGELAGQNLLADRL